MAQVSDGTPVALLDDHAVELWLLAMAFFVVGDVVTTGIGYRMEGVIEASPLPAMLLAHFGLFALVGLKLVVVGACYLLWVTVPREYAIGIPLGMTLLGLFSTGWNLTVLLNAIQ